MPTPDEQTAAQDAHHNMALDYEYALLEARHRSLRIGYNGLLDRIEQLEQENLYLRARWAKWVTDDVE
jgi:hypothetical protein